MSESCQNIDFHCYSGLHASHLVPSLLVETELNLSMGESAVEKGSRLIDPLQSLAFSIQANPGVYALLLGSGVSRSAEIPTGWEIVVDLAGKLAATTGEVFRADPEQLQQWYVDKYGELSRVSKASINVRLTGQRQ